jgi:hypothetical protein
MPKIKQPVVVMLEGDALLKKVKELENLTREEKAKACGYSTVTTKGKDRINSMKFLNAVMDAANINLEGKSPTKGGRNASYRVSVQKNGNLLIGSAYTLQMGLKPGDELEIKLGRKHINLKQLGISDSEE